MLPLTRRRIASELELDESTISRAVAGKTVDTPRGLFGLEFFFRGFLVHSLKPSLGAYAIFAMTVPYTMIHFQKPMAEAFAAIMAGIFLGWLSWRNGNIWMGLVLHCTVAFSMDILALYNKGLLF